MRNKLARGTLALLTAAASVAGITTAAGAIPRDPGDVTGYEVNFTAQGTATGTVNAGYTLLKGSGELDFVFFGEGFAEGVYHDVDLHKGTCATPGVSVDEFEIDPALRETPAEVSPRAVAAARPFDGTAGTLRYSQGSTTTTIVDGDNLETFEDDYVILIRERGAAAGDYLCGEMSAGKVVGNGAVVGTEYPFIFTELNSSGASATGTATLQGNILSFNLSYAGLDDTLITQHFQVLRQSGACPTTPTATVAEVEAAGGAVITSLTRAPRSILAADGLTPQGFDVSVAAETGGTLDYVSKIPLTTAQAAAFADSTVTIHGFDVNGNGTNDGASVIAPLTGDETAVVGCAQFKENAATVPDAPTGVTGSATGLDLTVSWTAPADDGGSAITGYTVTLDPGGLTATVAGTMTTEATFEDLAEGTYTATVVATNEEGDSVPSDASAPVEVSEDAKPPGLVKDATTIEEIVNATDYDVNTDPEILRLYQAFFNREPDVGGAIYWIGIRKTNGALEIAQSFPSASAEFQNEYADAANDEEFLTRVYQNMLDRVPDDDGFAYWLDILAGTNESGQNPDLLQGDRGAVVFYVALNAEFINLFPYLPAS